MRNLLILKPVDKDKTGHIYSERHSYMYQPFVDTIYKGFSGYNPQLIEIETGYNGVLSNNIWNQSDSTDTILKIIETLVSGDILIIMTSFLYKFKFNELKKRGIYVIVYETEAINQPWGRPIIYNKMIDKNSYPHEIWTYNQYNVWALKLRKINKKIKLRVVYPALHKCSRIEQNNFSKFLVMDSFYSSATKKRYASMNFLNEQEDFKKNNFPISWWNDESFTSKLQNKEVSGIALNIMKCSNAHFGKNRAFVRPLNTASIIKYLSFGVIVVSDLFQNKCNILNYDYTYFTDIVYFSHLYDIRKKIHELTNISAEERQDIANRQFEICKKRFDPTSIIKTTGFIE